MQTEIFQRMLAQIWQAEKQAVLAYSVNESVKKPTLLLLQIEIEWVCVSVWVNMIISNYSQVKTQTTKLYAA